MHPAKSLDELVSQLQVALSCVADGTLKDLNSSPLLPPDPPGLLKLRSNQTLCTHTNYVYTLLTAQHMLIYRCMNISTDITGRTYLEEILAVLSTHSTSTLYLPKDVPVVDCMVHKICLTTA